MTGKEENWTSAAACAGLLGRTRHTSSKQKAKAFGGSSGAALKMLQQEGLLWDTVGRSLKKAKGRSGAKAQKKQRRRERRIRG